MTSTRLYTWLDIDATVKRALRGRPEWLCHASAYPDGLVLTVKVGTKQHDLRTFLQSLFGGRYKHEVIFFDGMVQQSASLPVYVDEESS